MNFFIFSKVLVSHALVGVHNMLFISTKKKKQRFCQINFLIFTVMIHLPKPLNIKKTLVYLQ